MAKMKVVIKGNGGQQTATSSKMKVNIKFPNSEIQKTPNLLETKKYPNELLGDPLMSLVPNPIQDIKDNRINADVDKLSSEAREIKKVVDTYNSWEIPFANGKGRTYQKSVEARQNAITAREQFLKDAGFSSIEDAESSLKQKQNYASSAAKVQTIAQERQKMAELSDYVKTPEYEENFQGYNSFIAEKENEQKKTSTFPLIDNAMMPDSFQDVAIKNYADSSKNAKNDVTQYKVTDDWSVTDKAELAKLYSESPEKAMEFAKIVNTAIKNEEYRKTGEDHWILSSIASVPVSVLSSVDYLRNLVEYGTDKIMGRDAKLERSALSDLRDSLRQGAMDGTDWKIGNFDAFDFLYGVGMSMADMAAASMLGGGVNAITSKLATKLGTSVGGKILGKALTSIGSGSVLGLSAASSTMNDVLDRGGTDAQALTSGLVAGAFETLFESLSIGELKSMGRTSKEAFKELIKKSGKENVKILFKRLGVDALKSMGTNATEEAATELANVLYDTFANGDVSNYAIMVENYMKEDPTLTEEEARDKAIKQFTGQVLESAASGAIMGLFLGNGATVKAYMGANRQIQVNNAFDSVKKNIESNRLNNSINGVSGLQTESDADISEIGSNIKAQMNAGVRDSVSNIKNNLMQSAAKGSVTTPNIFNLSAANPKNDIVGDAIAKSSGVPNRTDDQRLLSRIGKAFNVKIEFADLDYTITNKDGVQELVSPEGEYDEETNVITLNSNAKDYHRPVEFVLKHELTHSTERAEIYDKFMAEVVNSDMFDTYVTTVRKYASADAWYADIIDRYEKAGKPLGSETETATVAAKKEAVADFVAHMILSKDADMVRVTEELLRKLDPTVRERFVNWVLEIFAKLKETFTGSDGLSELERLEKRFIETASAAAKQKTTTEDGSGKNSISDTTIIDLSDDNELSKAVDGLRGSERHNAIQQYILSVLSEQPITLSDGRQAIVDKSDASHLSSRSGQQRVVYISKIKKIIENAVYVAQEPSSKVGKFDHFYYYKATVRYEGEEFPMYLNVGRARNDGKYHIYDISKNLRDTAHRLNDVGRPVGNALENGISKQSIPENEQPVNNNYMQSGRKNSIAGPKSHTANLENLEKAKERDQRLKGTKANSENTRRKYGWFRGLDRMWRYEISDKEAEVDLLNPEYKRLSEELNRLSAELGPPYDTAAMDKMDEIVNAMTKVSRYRDVKVLGEILKHDKLYAAYPELRNYKVKFVELKDGSAEFDPATKTIKINKNTVKTIDIATIMHEVQHAIQDIEGFASGSSQEYWESIEKKHNEKLKEISDVFKEIEAKGGTNLVNLAHRYLDISAKVFENDANSEQLQREREGIEAQAKLKGSYRLLQKLLMLDIETRVLEKKLELFDSDYDRYYNTAGEIEARNVEERLRMTDEEREATRPDIDRKKVAFVEGKFRAADEGNIDEVAKEKGYSQKLYHQTGEDFNVFDTEHQKAGKYDPEMPTGTFLKPTDADIGLEGNKQMELYTKIKNPLQFNDRADAVRFWKKNVPGYAEAVRKIDRINEQYSKEVARAGMEVSEHKKEWRRNNPDADSRELYNDTEFQRLDEAEDIIVEEWDNASNEASLEAKKLIDAYMRDSGYDGVEVENDQGSFGRTVKTYIVFDSSQMKSADAVTYDDNGNEIPLSARFDSSKKDIRYSLPERKNFASGSRGTENLYDTPDSLKPNSESEWSAFNRSFANKTNGLKNNQKVNIMIYTADHAYFVSASGYMRGRIVSKILIDGNEEIINDFRKEFENGTFEASERFDILAQSMRSNRGRGYRHHASLKETLAAERDGGLDGEQHSGDNRRDNRRSGKNSKDVSYSLPEKDSVRQVADAYRDGTIDFDEYNSRINDLFTQAGEESGTIKPGEKVDPSNKRVPTPKSVSDGTQVRQFMRTVLESGYATPEMEAYLKELILEGDYSYVPTSNKKSIAKAERNIENQGYQNAVSNWQRSLSKSTVDADTVATGEALLRMAFDHHNAVDIVNLTADLAELGTRMGQAVQAFSLLKRMGGISQLVYLQRSVNKINEDLKQRFKGSKKDAPVVKMNEKLAERLAKAETEGEKEVIYGRIVKDIADQVPSTFLDMWNAWRYMAMLFNPTTHIRNVLGNGIFLPVVRMKDLIALGGEKIFVKAEDRTKVLKVKQEYQDFASKDFEKIKDMLTGTGKYNPSDNIRDEMAVFKNKILEGLRKFNFTALEKEDAIFLKKHYRHALGSFLQARNIDLKNMSNAQLLAARKYAFDEALKATYRDASKVANMLSQLSKTSKFANVLVEGVLPFKKTPINILKRGVEYSPIGIIKTLSKGIYDLTKGEFKAAQFIDGLAANAIGSIPFVIGMFLANMGIAKGGFDDEEEIDKLMGKQEYSIQIGDTSYTIDWLAPASIPFFMGVAISEYEADKDGDFLSNLYDFGIKGFEPILNLSMLSGVNDMIDSVSYAEDAENLPQLIGSGISSYFSQALPTIFGKTANIFDDTKRTRYVDKTSNVPEIVQKALDKIASKTPLPLVSQSRAEYVDAWGETKYTGNFFQRFFQQFVSPGYASTVDQSAISEECLRLYRETGEKSVVPSTPAKYFTLKGNRRDLSKEEYYNFATFRGQMSADLVNEAINNAEYQKLTDEQKAEVITDIYDYVGALAKSQLSYSYEEIAAMEGGEDVLTPGKWNKLNDKAKQILVNDYFLDGTKGKAYKQAKNGKSVVDFYVKKVKLDSKK